MENIYLDVEQIQKIFGCEVTCGTPGVRAATEGNDHSLLKNCCCKRGQAEFFQVRFERSIEGLRLRGADRRRC